MSDKVNVVEEVTEKGNRRRSAKWPSRAGKAIKIAFTAATILGMASMAHADPSIKIGVPLSMTGKGADYGILSATAAKMAVEKINETGGVNGTNMEIVIADTAGENQQAVLLTRRFGGQDRALAIVGYIFSGEVEQAFAAANALKVPVISISSAKPGIMQMLRPWGFRNTATEEKLQREAIAAWKERYNIELSLIHI